MHFEILVEDASCERMLERLMPKLLPAADTFRIHSYKGCGSIPGNLKTVQDPAKRILLDQLPRLLRGYGKTYRADPSQGIVVVICDLDDRNRDSFTAELNNVLEHCNPAPVTRFCLAVEEGEAWLLGDKDAIYAAYPKAKKAVLDSYVNDSICGTWEVLADALYRGGHTTLEKLGYQAVGTEKSEWAIHITPHMDVLHNQSPSFNEMKQSIDDFK